MITKKEMETINQVAALLEQIHQTTLKENPPATADIGIPVPLWLSLYTAYMKLWEEASTPKVCGGHCDNDCGC